MEDWNENLSGWRLFCVETEIQPDKKSVDDPKNIQISENKDCLHNNHLGTQRGIVKNDEKSDIFLENSVQIEWLHSAKANDW